MKNKILILSLAISAFAISLQDALAATNNYCGPNCTFTYTPVVDDDGNPVMITETYQAWNSSTRTYETRERQYQAQTLNISGTGTITEGNWAGNPQIVSVNIGEGITATSTAGNFSQLRNLESVSLPSTLTTLGQGAFANNPKLTSINLPDNLTTIGASAFRYSGLTEITIPNSVTSIGNNAFTYCYSLENVDLPENLQSIGRQAFYETKITDITIPDTVTSIGAAAFAYSQLTDVIIPDSVTSIGEYAFYATKLKDVTIPESVLSIGYYAFGTPTLENMTIEGDYVSFGSTTITSNWEASYYGVDIGDPITNILAGYRNLTSGLQNLYCSKEMEEECKALLATTGKMSGTSPQLNVFEKNGDMYNVNGDRYTSVDNMMKGEKANRRIYTVQDAEKVSKPTGNKFMLRYK